jgi:formylglycine-generating enzyme required for sulfatase activity
MRAGGEFSMDEGDDRNLKYVATLYIAKYPVTNAVYQSFVVTTGHYTPSHWRNGGYPELLSDHPILNVPWSDALTYCRWMREATGHRFRPPTEAEWEKAARGTERMCGITQLSTTTKVLKHWPRSWRRPVPDPGDNGQRRCALPYAARRGRPRAHHG